VLIFAYIIYRVIRTIKCSDPIFITMLFLLQMTLLSTILFYSHDIHLDL